MTLDRFTRGYIDCALWSSTGDDGEPLDAEYDVSDIAPEALDKMVADCAKFQAENQMAIDDGLFCHRRANATDAWAGQDFWLTRNGHGAGFWAIHYPGWHTFGRDRATVAAVARLAAYGVMELNHDSRQFRLRVFTQEGQS